MMAQDILPSLSTPAAFITLILLLPLLNKQIRRLLETWLAKIYLMIVMKMRNPSQGQNISTVSGLFIHPIKSLQAVELETAEIDEYGFVYDRRLMLVCPRNPPAYGFLPSDATHRFITQRQCPKLATVKASYGNDQTIFVSCHEKTLTIRLNYQTAHHSVLRARLWDNDVQVLDLGDEAAVFFQDIVGYQDESLQNIRLVYQTSPLYAPDEYVPPEARTIWGCCPKSSLTDGFPVLVACESSLQEVNRRLVAKGKDPIPMNRFRPNIVIRNTKPFEEDTWKTIRIGTTAVVHIVKGCPRCKQSCTDQQTGHVSDEPLTTLADFRAVRGGSDDVYFAQNAILYGHSISKGDVVTIIKQGTPIWDKTSVKPE